MDDGHSPAAVFDALGAQYERAFGESPAHHDSLRRLLEQLPPHARVLDVGCGTGRPTARTLAGAGHEVLGVDVSPVMVNLAASQVPEASFRCADIRELPLQEESFDGICVYFSLLQMPRTDQSGLLHKLGRALRHGGQLMVATVPVDVEDAEATFMGQAVRTTSFGAEEFTELVTGSGLELLWKQDTVFTPSHPTAAPEPQLFLHCRRA